MDGITQSQIWKRWSKHFEVSSLSHISRRQVFWISYKDLLRKYQFFDRTRLFSRDWQVTQQWTTVDVPWTADYNDTKFSFTLSKRTPIVIVLSQVISSFNFCKDNIR